MQILYFKSFLKEELIEALYKKLPGYTIYAGEKKLLIKTGVFTITGNVRLEINPEYSKITTITRPDTVFMPFILFSPLGCYVQHRKNKIEALKNEVAARLKEILTQIFFTTGSESVTDCSIPPVSKSPSSLIGPYNQPAPL